MFHRLFRDGPTGGRDLQGAVVVPRRDRGRLRRPVGRGPLLSRPAQQRPSHGGYRASQVTPTGHHATFINRTGHI